MNTLEEKRNQIDEIDTQMIALFCQRMEIAKEIAVYKKAEHLPVRNEQREADLLKRQIQKLSKDQSCYQDYIERFLCFEISLSCELQEQMMEQ